VIGNGGSLAAGLCAVEGGEQIARAFIDADIGPDLTILERSVNGQSGLVAQQDGMTVTVIAFDAAGDQRKHIWSVRNRENLRPWAS
jgi:hypothetical protein